MILNTSEYFSILLEPNFDVSAFFIIYIIYLLQLDFLKMSPLTGS